MCDVVLLGMKLAQEGAMVMATAWNPLVECQEEGRPAGPRVLRCVRCAVDGVDGQSVGRAWTPQTGAALFAFCLDF